MHEIGIDYCRINYDFSALFWTRICQVCKPTKSDMNYNAYLKGFLPQPEVTGVKSFD